MSLPPHFSLLFLCLISISGIALADFSCSSTIVPDLGGAWVCDNNWQLSVNEVSTVHTGVKKWVLYFQLPKFYAVSKIRTLPACRQTTSPVALLTMTMAVWDERIDTPEQLQLAETADTYWTPVEFTNFQPTGNGSDSVEFSGFARRAPYWRLTMQTVGMDIDCIPEVAFFARAGIAAMQQYVMELDVPGVLKRSTKFRLAATTNSCSKVTSVPSKVARYYSLDTGFYRKYTSTYGIPILSSGAVDDRALQRACYVVRFLLADREDIRSHMLSNRGRVAIIGRRETVPMVPEMRRYTWWTRRAAGGTYHNPVNVGAEENMLCERGDRYARNQDIFMHEFAHGIHLIACFTAIPNFNSRLQSAYNSARRAGLWSNTYANTDHKEYFAEGVQAYFNQQREGPVGGDGVQNHIDTREELARHDPRLYKIIDELFPCNNDYVPRCDDISQAVGLQQKLKLNCGGSTVTTVRPGSTVVPSNCIDQRVYCPYWASTGECQKNPRFMRVNCKRSCNACTTPAPRSTTIKTTTPSTSTTTAPTTRPTTRQTTRTTVRPITRTRTPCTDSNRHCSYWARIGECRRNPAYMRGNCRRSCGTCPSGAPATCEDSDEHCVSWTDHCTSNNYVRTNCKKSCKKCK